MVASSGDRGAGSTRRRPLSTAPSASTPTNEPKLASRARKFSRKSGFGGAIVIITVVVVLACCLLIVIHLISTRPIEEPHPMIRSISQPKTDKLLALIFPPGLFGGFRNQVIRLLSLVVRAKKNGIDSILLNSIQWATQVGNETSWSPIPMDLLFDVEYWNTFYPKLPRLVRYDKNKAYDCWHVQDPPVIPSDASELTKQVVSRGFLTPIYNLSKGVATREIYIAQRQTDLLPNVTHCQHPIAYGGGKMGGRLWNDYVHFHNDIPYNAQALVLQALRPLQQWRNVATTCVEKHTVSQNSNYIALHARVELEMMVHTCGRNMEKNFTKILEMVFDMSKQQKETVNGVFVAVGRSGMEHQEQAPGYKRFKHFIDENIITLNRHVTSGLQNQGRLPVFECGQQALQDYYYNLNPNAIDYGSTLQSMINFHVATEASIFVGVRGSSYSTDIWTTRFHLGKGDSNYEYTPGGIIQIDNGGLPPPHSNCKRKGK